MMLNAQVKHYVKKLQNEEELRQIAKVFGVNPDAFWAIEDLQEAIVEALKDTEKFPPNQVVWRGVTVTNEAIMRRLDTMGVPNNGLTLEGVDRFVEETAGKLRKESRGDLDEFKGEIIQLVGGLQDEMRKYFTSGQPVQQQLPHSQSPKQQPVLHPEDEAEPVVPAPAAPNPKVDHNKKGKDEGVTKQEPVTIGGMFKKGLDLGLGKKSKSGG